MLDGNAHFFHTLCPSGHEWQVFGALANSHMVDNSLVFTFQSIFDVRCERESCAQLGSLRLFNPDERDVYCLCTCSHCKRHTYIQMHRDNARETLLDRATKNKRYCLPAINPLFCKDCREKHIRSSHNEAVS